MINKIADIHFNALKAGFPSAGKVEEAENELPASPVAHDALNKFMSSPSFNTKQIAIESLLKQMMEGTSSFNDKTGTAG